MNGIAETIEDISNDDARHMADNPIPRLLTNEEWAKVLPPFCSIKVEYPEWGAVEYDIAVKWALSRSSGWVYFSENRFVFEKTEDYMLFKMWVSAKPMIDGDVEVE